MGDVPVVTAGEAARRRQLRIWVRLGLALVAGVLAGLLVPVPVQEGVSAHALLGYVAGGLAFALPLLVAVLRADVAETRAYVSRMPAARAGTDIVVIAAAIASLGGIATMLIGGSSQDKGFESAVTIATVATAWLLIHATYTLRYARHYYNSESDSVDFNTRSEPRFSDFAYLAFTLGMTYQVSDTDVHTPAMRRIILFHTILSYVFGTVIVAATINLIAGLAK